MKSLSTRKALWIISAALLFFSSVDAQKARPKADPAKMPVIFAVLDGGKRVEPIARIDGAGKLVDPGESDDTSKDFATLYYKPKTTYPIVFGGAPDGNITIVRSNIGTECGGVSADTIAKTVRGKLAGLVMALAGGSVKRDAKAYRRKPTLEERTRIEALVRAELKKQGTSAVAMKVRRYHNLTALDVDDDGVAEFIGSYWIAPTKNERRLLFFIAESGPDAIGLTHSDYSNVTPEDVMSGDVKDIDTGVGHELLLDLMDVDGDGAKEIFTIGQAFEGNNYYVYKRVDGKWERILERYNYRCAF